MEEIIVQLENHFDFVYMFSSIMLTYLIIKVIDYINGNIPVPTVIKRICLLSSLIILGIANIIFNNSDVMIIINSAIAAPVCWSWMLRPIFMKLGIGYKQIEDVLS